MEFLRGASEAADKKGRTENQQQISDDAAGDRGFDEFDVSAVERDDGDNQFRRVAERGVEEAAEARAGPMRQFLGAQ